MKEVGLRCSDEQVGDSCALPVSAITASPLSLGSATTFSGELKRSYWSFQVKCTEMYTSSVV